MDRSTALVPVLIAAAVAAAPPAAAVPFVDDFRNGWFSVGAVGVYQEHDVPIPDSQGHAMHSVRHFVFDPGPGQGILFQTDYAPNPAERIVRAYVGGGLARMGWEWGSHRDLTVLGTIDRIDMVLVDSPPGAVITAILTDGIVGSGVARTTTGGPEVLTFPFDEWTGVDVTEAVSLAFSFSADSDTEYRIADVRFQRTGALNVDFLGDFLATQVPPIPSSPLRFHLLDEIGDPLVRTDIVIADAVASAAPHVYADWATVSGPDGDHGLVDFRWDPDWLFADTFFRLSFDFAPDGGLFPEVFPPDPVREQRGIVLAFPMRLTDDGVVQSTSQILVQLDVDADQAAEFASANVIPHGAARGGGWTTGFDLTFDYAAISVDTIRSLFQATWWQDRAEAVATAAPVPAVTAAGMRLRARPAVTRGAAEILASRPFGAGARLDVLDVTGRRVGTLSPAAGARTARWDGADGAGRPLPAGVYFFRLDDGGAPASTRVTRVR